MPLDEPPDLQQQRLPARLRRDQPKLVSVVCHQHSEQIENDTSEPGCLGRAELRGVSSCLTDEARDQTAETCSATQRVTDKSTRLRIRDGKKRPREGDHEPLRRTVGASPPAAYRPRSVREDQIAGIQ